MSNKEIILAYKECEDCIYFQKIDKFNMICQKREKKYLYGQWVPCEDKKPLDVTLPIEVEESVIEDKNESEETVEETIKKELVKKVSKKTRKIARTNMKKRGD